MANLAHILIALNATLISCCKVMWYFIASYKDIHILWQSILLNPKNLSKEITQPTHAPESYTQKWSLQLISNNNNMFNIWGIVINCGHIRILKIIMKNISSSCQNKKKKKYSNDFWKRVKFKYFQYNLWWLNMHIHNNDKSIMVS